MFPIAFKTIGIVISIIFIALLILKGYVKAPPNKAYIISGLRKQRVLIGRAGIRIPFLERLDTLYLGQVSVDMKTSISVPTNDFINVNVDAIAKIHILPTEEGILLAAKNFLNKSGEEIGIDIKESLEGNLKEVIGKLSLAELNTDRDAFSDEVSKKAQDDMNKLGIEILSCNVQSVTDDNGLINDLGADNTAVIQKKAQIAKANAERDVAIAKAQAEVAANNERVTADTEIAEKNNELAIRQAELKILADSKQAEANAVESIKNQEQRKFIEEATVNADIAKADKQAELKKKEVEIEKQTLDAEIRAKADAERYKKEQEAEANLYERKKEAEAKLYELEQEAAAEMKIAEAKKYAKEQEAAGITALGEAEAKAIRAKALAEAEGIDKKADAMNKYGDAAIVEMIMQALPDIAKNVAEPLSKVDKITMYGEGNATKLIADIINGTTQVTEGIAGGLGLDLKAILSGALGGKLALDYSENHSENVNHQISFAENTVFDTSAETAETAEIAETAETTENESVEMS